MKTSEKQPEPFDLQYRKALLAFQKNCPDIVKIGKTEIQSKNGKKASYHYAPLPEIMDKIKSHLDANKLLITHRQIPSQGELTVLTRVQHEAGGYEESSITFKNTIVLENTYSAVNVAGNAAKALGALITYFRRYNIISLLNLVAEDLDDIDTTRNTKNVNYVTETSDNEMTPEKWKASFSTNTNLLVTKLRNVKVEASVNDVKQLCKGMSYKEGALELQRLNSEFAKESHNIISRINRKHHEQEVLTQ